MCPLVFFTWFMVLWSVCCANLTMDIETTTAACRTERLVYLPVDLFRTDTCARCYKYMPVFAFKVKFQYAGWGTLRDPRIGHTYEANLVNTSREVEESFADHSYLRKWKDCCNAAVSCCESMLDTQLNTDGSFCPHTWDGWQCWEDTPAGTTAKADCQGHIYFENEAPSCAKYAYKECSPNGTWYMNEFNKEWTNYTKCGRLEEHRRYLYFHIITYSISIVCLVPALIIFSMYKQLQVHRISMHKNLFLSLFLNGVAVVLFKAIVIVDELDKSDNYHTIMDGNGDACKILSILTRYFRMTNYMWMFCEGFYLHKLIAAAFAEQKNLIMFYMIGWVFPVLPVGIYAILRKTTEDEKCWALPVESYEWIMNAPNLASLLVNAIFLCNIIRVLVTKLRATHSNEPSQYRKAVRATLVLVPLFGLQFCLIIYRPPQTTRCGLLQAYTYFSHAMDGMQGFLVSLIFCYMNGEILHLLWRTRQTFRTIRQLSTNRKSRRSTCVMSLASIRKHSVKNDL
ncbi:hypothetical protein JTE90_018560 [Oedothorax gibbosus]|uniref:Calcitonin receptor n=1 Tax=Oedothorax gibbosus TaxID=931172 RepID=A0AAV6U5G8_9ARAC|nr:hypothetical protein JTE90_018560 [Oedothorax gibbosus]